MRPLDLGPSIFAYEAGELEPSGVVTLFQDLLDTGLLWQLQGSYQRSAEQMLRAGLVTMPRGGE